MWIDAPLRPGSRPPSVFVATAARSVQTRRVGHRAPRLAPLLLATLVLAAPRLALAQDAAGSATSDTAASTEGTAASTTAATDAGASSTDAASTTDASTTDAATTATTATTATGAASTTSTTTTTTSSSEPPWAAIITLSVAGAALLVTAIAGPLALVERDRLVGACAPRCTDAEIEGARNLGIVADVGLAVGLLGGVLGVVFLSISTGSSDSGQVAFAPSIGPEGATLTVAGRL